MGVFAKVADDALEGWRERLAQQRATLSESIQPAEMEAAAKARELLKRIRGYALDLGYQLRSRRTKGPNSDKLLPAPAGGGGVPGRELVINLPNTKQGWYDPCLRSNSGSSAEKKALFGAVTDPATELYEEAKLDIQRAASEELGRRTKITSSPLTIPTFLPEAAMSIPAAFKEGYRTADNELDVKRKAELERRLTRAKSDFDSALKAEYDVSKEASAGELIDGLSKLHIKEAEDDYNLNTAAGLYMALAALGATGAHTAAKSWVEKRDPRHQQLELMREAVRRRARAQPQRVLVAPPVPELQETSPDLST